MNKSVIVIIAVVAVVLVGIPLASQLMKSSETADTGAESQPADTAEPAGQPAPAASPAPSRAPAPAAPSGLNAQTLPNTVWAMKVQGVDLNVTFLPGGSLRAQSPLLRQLVGTDTVQGRWSCSGSNVNVSANAGGRNVSAAAVIQGNQLIVNGTPARRVR